MQQYSFGALVTTLGPRGIYSSIQLEGERSSSAEVSVIVEPIDACLSYQQT